MQKTTSNIEMLREQALSIICTPHPFLDFSGFAPIPYKFDPYYGTQRKINNDALFDIDGFPTVQEKLDSYCSTNLQINNDDFFSFGGSSPVQGKLVPHCSTKQIIHDNDEENIEERDFGFACTEVQEMHIFADEIFENGKIRPILHSSDQSLLFFPNPNNDASYISPPIKKNFIENSIKPHSRSGGIPNELQNDPLQNMTLVEINASSECYTKSNSTGTSNLWRFRQNLNLRSNSDHKDSFVLMNPSVPKKSNKSKVENIAVKRRQDEKRKSELSAYEKIYVTNKTRKESKQRKSFLPYKHQLFGLFTNKNGLSRNLHPF
ncbi:unnamed protein product [Trifolium pratense]|uniref:Uncharacterized protein n=1 Tax=Trifolium pratense TaxID=57577 RepID=A0ACB0JBB1_TRIPR|nr:unnamed protein product [Trifolium pratense]